MGEVGETLFLKPWYLSIIEIGFMDKQVIRRQYATALCQSVDIVSPVAPAICAMQYGNGYSASTAYSSAKYRTYLMGFPFECITTDKERNWVMKAILTYLLE